MICIFIVTRNTGKNSMAWDRGSEQAFAVLLIVLDMALIVGTACAIVAVVVVLSRAKQKLSNSKHQETTKEVGTVGGQTVAVAENNTTRKSKRQSLLERTRSEAAHKIFDRSHAAAAKQIELLRKKKKIASARLKQRLSHKMSMNHHDRKVVPAK